MVLESSLTPVVGRITDQWGMAISCRSYSRLAAGCRETCTDGRKSFCSLGSLRAYAGIGRPVRTRTPDLYRATAGTAFSYRRFDKLTPFAHVQLGAIHASQGYLGISTSAFRFAMTSGGGVDVKINQRAAIRLQGDYLMTRFLGLRQQCNRVGRGSF